MTWVVLSGDSAEVLPTLPAASFDALVTDPPAGIGFMGEEWDADRGGRAEWIAWLTGILREARRCLKPGAHALVWAIPRTSHWTATAIEDAGFEVRDVITHHYGTGFPKSLDVAKELAAGVAAQRNTIATGLFAADEVLHVQDESSTWDGWGTALKPATEHWILARAPLAGTVAENVRRHGTGGLNIDGCRIASGARPPVTGRGGLPRCGTGDEPREPGIVSQPHEDGRWPANLVLSHAADCVEVGARSVRADGHHPARRGKGGLGTAGHAGQEGLEERKADGEEVELWACVPGCPVRTVDEQGGAAGARGGLTGLEPSSRTSGIFGKFRGRVAQRARGDIGGASRFFYTAKPSRSERDAGLESLPAATGGEATGREDGSAGAMSPRAGAGRTGGARNTHPTVKSVALMRWLVRLVTPPGGRVLDPFLGSGSTAVACIHLGLEVVGVEREARFVEMARLRCRRAAGDVAAAAPLFASAGVAAHPPVGGRF